MRYHGRDPAGAEMESLEGMREQELKTDRSGGIQQREAAGPGCRSRGSDQRASHMRS